MLIDLKAIFDELTICGWTNLEIEKREYGDYQEYILIGSNLEKELLEKEKLEYQRLKAKFGDL